MLGSGRVAMLDDLNRTVKPHGLKFAPDISTASRATIGGMIANNSSGARSVVYGKTGDHVLGLRQVVRNPTRPSSRPARSTHPHSRRNVGRTTSKASATGSSAGLPRNMPTRSSGVTRRSSVAWGDYRLDVFGPAPGRVVSASTRNASSGRRGRSALWLRPGSGWSTCPGRQGGPRRAVRRPPRRAGRDPRRPREPPSGRRSGRPLRARQHEAQPRGVPAARLPPGRPGA